MEKYFCVLFAVVFLFYSCSKENPANPVPPAATSTATQAVPSFTVSATLTVTLFYSETVTATITETVTATATGTSTSTPTASPTKISDINLRITAGVYSGNGPDCGLPGLKWFVSIYDTYSNVDIEYAQVVIKNISQAYQVVLPWTELCGGGVNRYYASSGIDYTLGDTYRVEVTLDGTTHTAEMTNNFGNLYFTSDGLSLNWTGTASQYGLVSGNGCSDYNVQGTGPYAFDPSCYPAPDTYYMVASLSNRQYESSTIFSGTDSNSSFSFTNVIHETIVIP